MSKVAVVTTTINAPHALKLLHAHAPFQSRFDVDQTAFFVAGDRKTPEQECADVVKRCGAEAVYLSVETQKKLGYKCSELIGWDTIGRRNIALLEAIKWGAEIVVLYDDDNFPVDNLYFEHFREVLEKPFSGLCATALHGWFDVGHLLYDDGDNFSCPHRGFPIEKHSPPTFSPVTNVTVGVAAGICMGDPDISAVTRIARSPTVHHASKLLDAGIVVDPKTTRTVFNSQNTAFIRELAPCFLMVPQFGRHDDIYASIIAQQVMTARNMRVHFGNPFIWQQRNEHNLVKDLEAEIWGMKHILNFSEFVASTWRPDSSSVLKHVREIYDRVNGAWPNCPSSMVGAIADAWLEDIESVL